MILKDEIRFADPEEDLKYGPDDNPEIVKNRFCFNLKNNA